MRLRILALLIALAGAVPAQAAPQAYVLEPDGSQVGFETDFGNNLITGDFPVTEANLTLDFKQVANCKVAVTLDISGARASFPFAAQALKGPKVLDAAAFPHMTFASSKVSKDGTDAKVEGMLTLRGVTRPITLHATILRQQGIAAGDLSHLVVHLTGSLLRSDYGATGWADMVGDEVRIDIRARIKAQG